MFSYTTGIGYTLFVESNILSFGTVAVVRSRRSFFVLQEVK